MVKLQPTKSAIVVYTAVAGGFDTPFSLQEKLEGVRYVAYSDVPFKSDFWEVRGMNAYEHDNPRRRTRYFKMHPHLLFPEAKVTVWLDASTDITTSLYEILDYSEPHDLVGRTHPVRSCAYQEGVALAKLGYPVKPIATQLKRYDKEGFPDDYGLMECRILVRKNNELNKKFNELWFEEYEQGSERDQVSMMYCVWKTQLDVNMLPFKWVKHRSQKQRYGYLKYLRYGYLKYLLYNNKLLRCKF